MAESMEMHIEEDGTVFIPFFPVSFSEFIVDHVYDEEEKKRIETVEALSRRIDPEGKRRRKIFCG